MWRPGPKVDLLKMLLSHIMNGNMASGQVSRIHLGKKGRGLEILVDSSSLAWSHPASGGLSPSEMGSNSCGHFGGSPIPKAHYCILDPSPETETLL